MGNQLCCEAEINHSLITDNLQRQEDYIDSQWPQNDQIIEQCIRNNQCQQFKDKKPKKHNRRNQYFLINWQDSLPTGKGILYQPKKFLYQGNFKNGIPAGRSQIKFIKDDKINSCYEGQIYDGKAQGQGSYNNFKQQYMFQGVWKDSKPQAGTLNLLTDQNVSKIYFSNFQQRKAIVYYKDDRIYQGQLNISKLVPDGWGKVVFPFTNQKDFYQGEWFLGKMHGKGIFVWKDRSQYEGSYNQNRKEGYGIFTYASGKIYKGYWKEGKQDGTGILYDKLGIASKKGIWKNGIYQKKLDDLQWQQTNSKYQSEFINQEKILQQKRQSIRNEQDNRYQQVKQRENKNEEMNRKSEKQQQNIDNKMDKEQQNKDKSDRQQQNNNKPNLKQEEENLNKPYQNQEQNKEKGEQVEYKQEKQQSNQNNAKNNNVQSNQKNENDQNKDNNLQLKQVQSKWLDENNNNNDQQKNNIVQPNSRNSSSNIRS